MLSNPEVVIVGGGAIGLTLALELRSRGMAVTVVERGRPLAQASTAAAGMLSIEDPFNPPELLPLARLSGTLYPGFLAQIRELSGVAVPLQTEWTLQRLPDGSRLRLREHSLDPRQLAPALLRAVRRAGIRIQQVDAVREAGWSGTPAMQRADAVIFATGAWTPKNLPLALPVVPRKGQMLRVKLPQGFSLEEVHRAEHLYVVPRLYGPQAGTALVGATLEDAGFDVSLSPDALASLRREGAELVPEIGDERRAPTVEAWAGLRPATPDGLPLLGEPSGSEGQRPESWPGSRSPRVLVATGHFRNGILLAPATAAVLADVLEGRSPAVDLRAFSPARFVHAGAEAGAEAGSLVPV